MALVDENYRDDCELRDQDIVDMERYLSMRDRASATGRGVPFFSGRETEISHLRGLDDRAAGQTVERCFKVSGCRGNDCHMRRSTGAGWWSWFARPARLSCRYFSISFNYLTAIQS